MKPNMKLLTAVVLSFSFITAMLACSILKHGSDKPQSSEGPSNIYLDSPLAGKINGKPWVFGYAAAKIVDQNTMKMISLTLRPGNAVDPCFPTNEEMTDNRSVLLSVPNQTSETLFNLANGKLISLEHFDDGKADITAAEGKAKIDNVSSSLITGHIFASYDGDNTVNGTFSAKVCDGSSLVPVPTTSSEVPTTSSPTETVTPSPATSNKPLINPSMISVGRYHSCALDQTGVRCWGDNERGQTNVPALKNPKMVSAARESTCALDDTGVRCWGASFSSLVDEDLSIPQPSLTNPVSISAGRYHACALDKMGVHCWGINKEGQANVPNLTDPTFVTTGQFHTCAIDQAGVHCWGYNHYGQTNVPPLTNPVMLSEGVYHTCALDETGVHCWGDNRDGQTNVPNLNNPITVSAGEFHTCAIDKVGVHCWGNNEYGQTNVPNLIKPIMVSAGVYHTCALDQSGVHCWGFNGEGQTNVPGEN